MLNAGWTKGRGKEQGTRNEEQGTRNEEQGNARIKGTIRISFLQTLSIFIRLINSYHHIKTSQRGYG